MSAVAQRGERRSVVEVRMTSTTVLTFDRVHSARPNMVRRATAAMDLEWLVLDGVVEVGASSR